MERAGAQDGRGERVPQREGGIALEERRARHLRRERARPPQAERIEAREQHATCRPRFPDHRDGGGSEPPIVGAIALELHVDEQRRWRLRQHLGQQRNALAAELLGKPRARIEGADRRPRCLREERRMARGPAQRLVVEHHHFSGRAPLRVQLDTVGAQLRREPEGGQRVFRGRARRAAVRPDERPPGPQELLRRGPARASVHPRTWKEQGTWEISGSASSSSSSSWCCSSSGRARFRSSATRWAAGSATSSGR